MSISAFIDHTLLKPAAIPADIEKLCHEALVHNFAAVCVPPPYVNKCKSILFSKSVKIATVIGFPFGYSVIESKIAETVAAIADGADELDMVVNLIALKSGDWDYLEREVTTVLQVIRRKEKILKVIIESGTLTDDEIIRCCRLYAAAGADFVKTSTGFAEKGASVEAVQLMRRHLPSEMKIKASGGIKTYAFAKKLLEAGAERLGCSSSVAIVQEENEMINKIL